MSPSGRASKPRSGQEDLTSRTIRGLAWSFSNSGVKTVLRIGTLAVLARLVTPEEFGLVTAAMVVLDLVQRSYQIGVGKALVQRADLTERHVRTAFTLCTFSGMIFSALIVAMSPAIGAFFSMPDLVPVLRALGLLLMLNALGTVSKSLLQRDLAYDRLTVADIIAKTVGYAGVGIGMALAGFGVWALVGAALVYRVLLTGQLMIAQRHSMTPLVDIGALRDLLGFGGGSTLTGFLNYFAQEGDNFIVGRWLGPLALGLYGRAYTLFRMPLYLFGMVLNDVMFSSFSRMQEDRGRMGRAYRRGTALIALTVLPISVFSFILAPEIIDVVLGDQWSRASGILQIFAVGMLFRTAYPFNDSFARATGAVYRLAGRTVIYAVLVIAGAWLGTRAGVEGVAIGVTVAVMLQYMMLVRLSLTFVDLSWTEYVKAHIPGIVIAAVVGLECLGFTHLMRLLETPTLVTLVTTSAVVAGTLGALIVVSPARILGSDGLWIAGQLAARFSARIPYVRVLRAKLNDAGCLASNLNPDSNEIAGAR